MNLNFNINRNRWNNLSYNNDLISISNENSNKIFIDILKQNNFNDIQKYPNLRLCYDLIINFLNINNDTIIFGFGSDQILKDLFMTLDYKSIQIFDYSWAMAEVYNQIFKKNILNNGFIFKDKRFQLKNTPEKIGGDVLYIINPHCPTGFKMDDKEIINLATKFKYIIVDETYDHPLQLNKKLIEIDNIIIVKSFSKLGGVPGMRIGYCVANKSIINKMFVIKPTYELCAQSIKYLQFIINNNNIINDCIQEFQKCFEILKKINGDGFNIQCGNFGTFQKIKKFNGRNYIIDNIPITRVTLTDSKNSNQLLL